MLSKLVVMGSFLAVVAVAAAGRLAYADNINTNATVCQPVNGWAAPDIDYYPTGIGNSANTPRDVVCAIPRSPLTTSGPAYFYVDGVNNNGTTTLCTVYAYTYQGIPVASTNFMEPVNPGASVTWDHLVTLPSLGYYDYVSVLCLLPGGSGGSPRAFLMGVTSVQ